MIVVSPPAPWALCRGAQALVLAAAIGGWLGSAGMASAQGGPNAPPPPVTVAKPVVKEIQETDDFIGRFDAVQSVEIRARVQGYLDRVHFTDGAMIKAGDLLFTIDQCPYRLAIEQAQATLTSAQARVEFAQAEVERAEQLRRTGSGTEQLAEQRRQNFLTAQADLNGARSQLADARLNLEYTEIRSPIAGKIGRRLVTEGNLVAANTSILAAIVSTDPIYFYFDIDERSYLAYARMMTEAVKAEEGRNYNAASITLTDANGPPRKAELDFIDNRLDEASGTLRVRARVPNADGYLVPGLFGRISITGSPPYRAALIPDEAIATDQDRRIVMVVEPDGTVRAQTIRPGPRQSGYRVVREGLKGDETIVIAGIQRARPGQKVTPQATTLPPTREAASGAGPAQPSDGVQPTGGQGTTSPSERDPARPKVQ
jgi:membrane fusion protein, multidrug efflux system